jgi:hypothetical protein
MSLSAHAKRNKIVLPKSFMGGQSIVTDYPKALAAAMPGAPGGVGLNIPNDGYANAASCKNDPSFGWLTPSDPLMWKAAQSVAEEKIIPAGKGYQLAFKNWPKLSRHDGKLVVNYGSEKNQESNCTSATATALLKFLADLSNAGKITLTDDHLEFINSQSEKDAVFLNGINGDSFAPALLVEALGGTNITNPRADNLAEIKTALQMARPGDILTLDRKNRSGHRTIFSRLDGDRFCYWSSNTRTKGVGEQCESISNMTYVSVSRLPERTCRISDNLDRMMKDKLIHARLGKEIPIAPNWVSWSSRLERQRPAPLQRPQPIERPEPRVNVAETSR